MTPTPLPEATIGPAPSARAGQYGQFGWAPAAGYRVLRVLQRGNDFDTFDAWSDDRHARCVLKTISSGRHTKDNRLRLRREGTLLTTLTHPHVVRGYELVSNPRLLVVMETLTGATLSHLLRSRRLHPSDIAHLGAQLASALRFLHQHDVLHLDIKPGNIIIGGGTAHLIDFSLAQPPGRIKAGLGTQDYLSPEQAAGDDVTPAADVWGLGLTLYTAATGVNPFRSSTPTATHLPAGHTTAAHGPRTDASTTPPQQAIYPQQYSRAPRAASHRRLPHTLATLLDTCLEPQPAHRPTMADLDQVLNVLAGTDRPPWPDETAAVPGSHPARR